MRISCLLLLLAPRLLAAGLVNGGFEAAGRAPDGMPDGWYAVPSSAASAGNLSVQQRGALGGGCLVFTDPWRERSVAAMSWFYPAVPGETYRTTCRVFNDTGDGWLYLQFFSDPIERPDAALRVWEKHAGSGKVGEWATISVDGVCPPTARYVQLCLYSSLANRGSCAFDDVTLDGPAGPGEPVAPAAAATEKPVDLTYLRNVGDRKQLLFDDAFFESHQGFWWRVCPPTKTGEQNVVADRPWESFTINAWTSLIEEEGRCRLWYECYDKTYTSDLQARYAYAESTDGIHWTKPNLGLYEFAGSRDNNLLFGALEGHGTHGGTVFRDPHGPPAERYKFIYLSGDQAAGYNVWAALSPDGIHWQRHNAGPVLKVSSDTQTVAFWDERLGRYVAYCRLWSPNRTVGRSESADFFSFPPADEVLAADAQDPPDTDLYNSAAMQYPFADNAYLIFTSVYYHPSDNLDVHLAVSRDGVHWRRPERRAFIPNGPPGSFDDGMVYCGTGVMQRGAELWMLYWGTRARHNQSVPALVHSGGVYSRAVLRLDGYVALDASLQPATFVTHPLTFTGTRLEVNAEVRTGGSVRFELQDEAGQPLPGYGLDECVPLVGDDVRHVVRWTGGADVSARAGKPTKLRAVATDASLYAVQFARE